MNHICRTKYNQGTLKGACVEAVVILFPGKRLIRSAFLILQCKNKKQDSSSNSPGETLYCIDSDLVLYLVIPYQFLSKHEAEMNGNAHSKCLS